MALSISIGLLCVRSVIVLCVAYGWI